MASPKSSRPGCCGWFTFATCEATTSAFVDPVKYRNWSNWCDAMSHRMPPYCSLTKNQAGRVLRLVRCGPRPTVWITRPMAPAFTSSPAFTVARFSSRSL